MNSIEEMNDLIARVHPISVKGLKHLEEYFDSVHDANISDKARVDNLNAATLAAKTIGMEGRLMASRANTAGAILQTAVKMGLAKQALVPLWKSLTGASADLEAKSREPLETHANQADAGDKDEVNEASGAGKREPLAKQPSNKRK